jgi:hypothetical protein
MKDVAYTVLGAPDRVPPGAGAFAAGTLETWTLLR